MKKILEKKLLIGVITGFVLSFGIAAIAQVNDSWNIGEGWLWFAETAGGDVRANVEGPLEDTNVANKEYVHAALSEGGGGGVVCTSAPSMIAAGNLDPSGALENYNEWDETVPAFWCCIATADGLGFNCLMGYGSAPSHKYLWDSNTYFNTTNGDG